MMPLRPLFSRLLPLCLLAAALPAIASPLVLQTRQVRALGIEVVAAGSSERAQAGTLPARVVVPPEQLRVVAAPLAGTIEALLVAPGDAVRAGQALVRLVSREAMTLQREAAQADSQAVLLQQSLKRDEQLFAEGLIAEARLQATRAAAAQAEAQARERRLGVQAAGAAGQGIRAGMTLTAPLGGTVLDVSVETGQRVEAATPLYRIAALNPLWLEIQAPLAVARQLQPGQTLRLAGREITARLRAIGRQVDAGSQSVVLRAEVRRGAEQLTPGELLAVEVPAPTAEGGQTIPAAAIVREDGQALVFLQSPAEAAADTRKFVVRPVTILSQSGNQLTVDGLKAGEMIVVRGVSALKAMRAGVGRE